MKYLIDSDYLINFLNQKSQAQEVLRATQRYGLATSVICIAEVLEGIYAQKDKRALISFEKLLRKLRIYPIDSDIASQFAKNRALLRKKGLLIDKFDLLIGTTCVVNDLILITGNRKHFRRIPGLKIYPNI